MKLGPLSGYIIGVTADRRSNEQIELLTRKGATVIHGPTIRTYPLADEEKVADATRSLIASPPDMTVLTTAIGVRGWFEAAESLDLGESLLDTLASSEIFARGKKAHGAAITAGLTTAWQAPYGMASELIDELERRDVKGLQVAVQLDGGDWSPIAGALERLGADVVAVPVYRWTLPDDLVPVRRLISAIAERKVHAVTFTARPQVKNLCALASADGLLEAITDAFASDVMPVCVGPVCASAAREAGFQEPIAPTRFRLGSMVRVLADDFIGQALDIELAGVAVRIQGNVVVIDDREIQLSDREAAVLHALAARVGSVVSKPQLLQRVWQGQESDEHVVEVTVGRLRSRLGEAGVGVETVVRRGYRLSAA